MSGPIIMKYQIQNPSQTVAGEEHLSRKWSKLIFSTIGQKSAIQISQSCEEKMCTVSGPIIIKYQIKNPSQTVAWEVHLSRKWVKLTLSTICQKIINSNFTKL